MFLPRYGEELWHDHIEEGNDCFYLLWGGVMDMTLRW